MTDLVEMLDGLDLGGGRLPRRTPGPVPEPRQLVEARPPVPWPSGRAVLFLAGGRVGRSVGRGRRRLS